MGNIIMENEAWQLQEAKNKFSSLVEKAQQEGPQIVTRHGKKAVVVVAFDEYKKMVKPKSDLVMFLRQSPLADIELKIKRSKDMPRDIEI